MIQFLLWFVLIFIIGCTQIIEEVQRDTEKNIREERAVGSILLRGPKQLKVEGVIGGLALFYHRIQ